ncbi:MAG: sigma-70 family RNA polymerase sigma factor [Corynebacteriales bacterium]|nr:sigma-70 family RNA polymerase sigma factor [Mycobacteriales bacterium]
MSAAVIRLDLAYRSPVHHWCGRAPGLLATQAPPGALVDAAPEPQISALPPNPLVRVALAALRHTIWLSARAHSTGENPTVATGRASVQAPRQRVGSAPPPLQPPDGERGAIWDSVRRAQEGDAEAFGEIYDHYVDMVYRYIYFRVATRQLAEDLTSETFLRALRRIGTVTWQGRDLGAWLVTIARNLIADHFKSGRYRLEISTADMLDQDQEDNGAGSRPESEVLDRLTNETLLMAVRQLNPEQQECIVLRFLQGMSVSETAAIMGKNDGAIKALQYRAVRSLGRLLPEGFTP